MTESLLRVVLLVLLCVVGGSALLLFGHGWWLTWSRRRSEALLAPARAALNAEITAGRESAEGRAALRSLPPRLRTRLVLELISPLGGSARDTLTDIARSLGVVDLALAELGSRYWWRRLHAARTLTHLQPDARLFSPLLDDPHPLVQAQAVDWAGENPTPATIARMLAMLPTSPPAVRAALQEALLRAGPVGIAPLCAYLEEHSGDDALLALRIARGVAHASFLNAAVRLSGDRVPLVRTRAAELVGAIGGEQGTAILVGLLTDEHPDVRAAAIAALGQLRYWPAATHIAERLRDPAWDVRMRAGTALLLLGSPGQLLLRRYAGDQDIFAADMARRMLETPRGRAGGAK